jgi:hypothetical protein
MARAKRVSKAYGTKFPTEPVRKGLPTKGYRTKGETTGAMTQPKTGVQVLTGQAALYVGRPGFGGRIPGPIDGKVSVKRVIKVDPRDGLSLPAADKFTNSHVDIVGPVNPKSVIQPLPSQPAPYDATGARLSIATPRKSPPVFSLTPNKVTRSPDWGSQTTRPAGRGRVRKG